MSESIIINEIEYVRKDENSSGNSNVNKNSEIKIVILQRGWVAVGYFERHYDNSCSITKASVIRTWGTTKGLGEIAINGVTENTILDKCGDLEFDYLTVVSTMGCDQEKWVNVL